MIGVLALQGDFAAHIQMIERIGSRAIEVRRASDLQQADYGELTGLILPGGESSTMMKLLEQEDLLDPLQLFAASGKPILGTCAGAILLACEVIHPGQKSLNLIDITIARNAYGRQVDSHIAEADTQLLGGSMEAVFIRAPRIVRTGKNVSVLASIDGEPIFVREANLFAATFHPELTTDERIHRFFLQVAEKFPPRGE